MSLYVSEKNATSEPATKKEITNNNKMVNMSMEVAPGVIIRKFNKPWGKILIAEW